MHRKRARARRAKRVVPARIYHPGPPIADEASLRQAAEALRERDPKLVAMLMAIGGPPPLRRREPGFAGLAAIIVSQQLSVASAKAILGRLEARIAPLEAAGLAAATEDDLRACGLSTAKIRALRAALRSDRRTRTRSCGPGRARRRGRACGARRGQGHGSLDGRHFPPVLPRTSRRLSRRRSRSAGGGEAGPQAQDATGRGAARADRRALAPLAGRRGAHVVGLLPRRRSSDRGWPWRRLRVKAGRVL